MPAPRTIEVSALPPSLANAAEADVLDALLRLLRSAKISASQARSLYVAHRVERDGQYYARVEMTIPWMRKET
jgi:hypothetical protein